MYAVYLSTFDLAILDHLHLTEGHMVSRKQTYMYWLYFLAHIFFN